MKGFKFAGIVALLFALVLVTLVVMLAIMDQVIQVINRHRKILLKLNTN